MKKLKPYTVMSIVLLLVIGLVSSIVYVWLIKPMNSTTSTPQMENKKILYWYDPMVPDQHFDKPGKSPFMDMDLVPKYAGE